MKLVIPTGIAMALTIALQGCGDDPTTTTTTTAAAARTTSTMARAAHNTSTNKSNNANDSSNKSISNNNNNNNRAATTTTATTTATTTSDDPRRQPSVPVDILCEASAQPGSLAASAKVDPSVIDEVSFAVANALDPEKWFFLHQSVGVLEPSGNSASTEVKTTIRGLKAGNYTCMARSKRRGGSSGYYLQWSKSAHFKGTVAVTAQGLKTQAVQIRRLEESSMKTQWIEVWRHHSTNFAGQSEGDNDSLPDYLDGHNAGDAAGVLGSLWQTTYVEPSNTSSYTRYCVEMATVNHTCYTCDAQNKDITSSFVNYESCNRGTCMCMVFGDRVIWGFQSNDTYSKYCTANCSASRVITDPTGGPGCYCVCPAHDVAEGKKYVGMMPVALGACLPGSVCNRVGRWYSFPPGGRCEFGAKVGDNGCTWQISPLSYSFSVAKSLDQGIFDPAPRKFAGGAGHPEKGVKYMQEELLAQPCGPDR
eukprot:TRINITY_DN5524_c0_g1_i1.p1 TRINITY_DN5524_c0_g1~~TRINITY_DN5524_c0_g1_i1.p1  ORF type:complete len:478 (-),score=70.51 TRINITY_DN5524_c0_g1_i1:59-1492(-)